MLVIALLFILAPALSGQTAESRAAGPSVDSLIKEALSAYQSGRMEIALKNLTEAHKIAPANVYASLYLGLILNQKNPDSLESQRLMESVLDSFPTNPDLLLRLMDSYLRSDRKAKATALLNRIQKPMEANLRFAFSIVYTLIRYAQLDPAGQELERISSRVRSRLPGGTEPDPKSSADRALVHDLGEISFIAGLIAASSNQKSEAMHLFQAADRHDFPAGDSIQMQMLAEALLSLEEYKLSVQAYKVYLEHFPRDTNARMHLAVGYYSAGLFTRAAENFKKVLEEAPETPNVHLYLGMILLEQKNNDEARKHFQEELEDDPKSYQSMAELAYLDYLSGDDKKSIQWLEKAQALNPDWYETNMVFGLLYNRQGQFDRAIRCLESVVQSRPKYYKAHFQLSLAFRRNGNEAKAEEHFKIYERLLAEEKTRQLEGVSR